MYYFNGTSAKSLDSEQIHFSKRAGSCELSPRSPAMPDPTSDSKPPEPNQLVPADYFVPLRREEICAEDVSLELDLGCGDGSFLLDLAEKYPDRHFVGVERLMGRVRKVCRKARQRGLENVEVLRLETLYTMQWLMPESSVDRVHVLCPDPWPKAKHHKRRIMQAPFFEAVCRVLKPEGEFLFMTDDEPYYEWAIEHTEAFDGLKRLPWEEDDFFYPKTDFQQQWEAEGKSMNRLRFVPNAS